MNLFQVDYEPEQTIRMLIPSHQVGLVIGKAGKTIKNLQEQAGVKMVIVQDSNIPSHQDKPLHITGSMHSCSVSCCVLTVVTYDDHWRRFIITTLIIVTKNCLHITYDNRCPQGHNMHYLLSIFTRVYHIELNEPT